MFWGRSGRIHEFVPWARHSFTVILWTNHLGVMLEWRCWSLLTCFLWELNKFVCTVSCKGQLLYPPCNVETQKYAYMCSWQWRARGNSVMHMLGFLLPWRLRRARYSQGMQIRGNGRNLGCEMKTTSFVYIYGDTGFERKWENSINEALSLCWLRLHSGFIFLVEIFTVPETTVSKVGKVTLSLPACDELCFLQIAWWSWQPRPLQLKLSSMCVAVKWLPLHFVTQMVSASHPGTAMSISLC